MKTLSKVPHLSLLLLVLQARCAWGLEVPNGAPARVGPLGESERLSIEGVQTFTQGGIMARVMGNSPGVEKLQDLYSMVVKSDALALFAQVHQRKLRIPLPTDCSGLFFVKLGPSPDSAGRFSLNLGAGLSSGQTNTGWQLRRDYEMLLDPRSVITRCLANLARELGTLTKPEVEAIAELFPPEGAAVVREADFRFHARQSGRR